VGLITATSPEDGGACWVTWYHARACTRMIFTPLLPSGGSPGIASELGVDVLRQE
jgi:hypothetical protein